MINCALLHDPETENLMIRLYGGWMEKAVLTNKASQIQQNIGETFPIPHPKKPGLLRGRVELALSLHGMPNFIWPNTLRQRSGLPRLRISHGLDPGQCPIERQNCPVRILRKFSKSKKARCPVDGCQTTNASAFSILEQKMVDTLLSCDIITLSQQASVSLIMVMTDDFDIYPAIAMAGNQSTSRMCVVSNNVRREDDLQSYFGPLRISTHQWRASE